MDQKCEICGQTAHGNHFGVITCRACAAFFRRAATNPDRSKNVTCFLGPCHRFQAGFWSCKQCRLKRCLEKGMDISKLRVNREVSKSLATFLGRPTFLLFANPLESSKLIAKLKPSNKSQLSFDHLIQRTSGILENGGYKPWSSKMNSLEKISMSFRGVCMKSDALQYVDHLQRDHTLLFFEQDFLRIAELFTDFDEFQELPLAIRMEILKTSWMMWGKLKKLAKTAEFRRKKKLASEKMFMVSDEVFLDAEATDIEVAWYTEYSKKDVEFFLNCFHNTTLNQVINELSTLQPTNTELNFMLIHVCLQHSEKKRQDKHFTDIIERLQSVISNQLHNYYIQKWKMPNYSVRVAKMMKVGNLMRRETWELLERMQLGELFDVFTLEFNLELLF